MQVILGAGGAIGIELAKALPDYTDTIRLVSRNPSRVNKTDELFSADLTDPNACIAAVDGADVVYLTAGLPYNAKLWQEMWPKVMRNTIDACKSAGAKLVFFDNIYMYDPSDLNPITEELPVNPQTKKGKVRAQIAGMLMEEVNAGSLRGLIARSADFYGPGINQTSMLTETVFNPLNENKSATWLCNANKRHSFTYTPDAGKATALLGNSDDAYGEVWHLPTAVDPPTGKEWIQKVAEAMDVKPKYRVAGKLLVRLMGIFIPVMGEMYEMLYQYDREYVFSSEKFDGKFDFKTTTYEEGISEIVAADY